MARRDEIRVSLFPFMSVLACTIGALTLLLATLSLSAVTPTGALASRTEPDPAAAGSDSGVASGRLGEAAESGRSASGEAAGARRPRERDERIERDRAERARTIARAEALWAEVDQTLAHAGKPPAANLAELEAAFARERQGRRLGDDLAAAEQAEAALARERDALEVEIAVLESRRATLPILIDPTGIARHLDPWFATCDAGGLATHGRRGEHGAFVARDELSPSLDYGRYLRRLRVVPGALLVLLIRPDGLATAARAAAVAEGLGVRVARLPLPGDGKLDFSLLRPADAGHAR